MWVIDASLLLEVLLGTGLGLKHADRIFQVDASLHAPHLIDVEVVQVLRRLTLAGELNPVRAREAVDLLADLPMSRYEHVSLAGRMWELRESLTSYDAAYVALAEGLAAPLLTCDGKLARAHGHRARIELLD